MNLRLHVLFLLLSRMRIKSILTLAHLDVSLQMSRGTLVPNDIISISEIHNFSNFSFMLKKVLVGSTKIRPKQTKAIKLNSVKKKSLKNSQFEKCPELAT